MRAFAAIGLALAGQVGGGLAALADQAHDANAAFARAQLKLELLGQEVVESEAAGGNVSRALSSEHRQLWLETNATEWLDKVGSALEGKDAALGRAVAQVQAREAAAEAAVRSAAAKEALHRERGLTAKVALLRGREANLTRAVDAADARLANATASLVPGVLDQQVKDEVEASAKVVSSLRQSAKAELRALRKRERGAPPRELAALRWQKGSVKTKFVQAKSASTRRGTELEERLRVFEITKPLLASKSRKLHAKLRHLENEVATVMRAKQQAQAEDDSLTAQVQDLSAQASLLAVQSGTPVPSEHRSDLRSLHRELEGLREQRSGLLAKRVAVEHGLNATRRDASAKQALRKTDLQGELRQSGAASGVVEGLDASALDATLATDPDQY